MTTTKTMILFERPLVLASSLYIIMSSNAMAYVPAATNSFRNVNSKPLPSRMLPRMMMQQPNQTNKGEKPIHDPYQNSYEVYEEKSGKSILIPPTTSQHPERLFHFDANGNEVSDFLPPLGRRLDLGIGCYYTEYDIPVLHILRQVRDNIHPQDVCWALDACHGESDKALLYIEVANRYRKKMKEQQQMINHQTTTNAKGKSNDMTDGSKIVFGQKNNFPISTTSRDHSSIDTTATPTGEFKKINVDSYEGVPLEWLFSRHLKNRKKNQFQKRFATNATTMITKATTNVNNLRSKRKRNIKRRNNNNYLPARFNRHQSRRLKSVDDGTKRSVFFRCVVFIAMCRYVFGPVALVP